MSKTDTQAAAKKTTTKAKKPKWDKNDPRGPRPSPTVSASSQDVDTVMKGNDGNDYIVIEYTGKGDKMIKRWKKQTA